MKKQVKRYASVLTALAMLFGVCTAAVPASAATINIEDEAVAADSRCKTIADGVTLNYITKQKTAQATITGISSTVSIVNLVIPPELDGCTVTCISENAFYNKQYLTSVYIPDTVTEIDDKAFRACTSLERVYGGAHVKKIGNSVFEGCKQLKSVQLPNWVESFGGSVFAGCQSLTKLILPKGITSLRATFQGCTNLQFVRIPEGVATVDQYAFYKCTGLTEVILPSSVQQIHNEAFLDGRDSTVICGYKGSAAEQFAKKHGNPFCELSTKAKVQLHNGKSYFIGDITTNNVIEDDDHRYLQGKLAQLVSFPKDKWHEVLADVNKDGSVDIRDVTSLQRYLAQNKGNTAPFRRSDSTAG